MQHVCAEALYFEPFWARLHVEWVAIKTNGFQGDRRGLFDFFSELRDGPWLRWWVSPEHHVKLTWTERPLVKTMSVAGNKLLAIPMNREVQVNGFRL